MQPENGRTGTTKSGHLRRILLIGGVLFIVVVAGVLYQRSERHVSTDDAFVQAARVDISTNIAGRVTAINIKDNQYVRRGEVLFRLDDRDLQITVRQARAELAEAMTQVRALRAVYRQHQADVVAAQEEEAFRRQELARQVRLTQHGISSREQLDTAQHDWLVARQRLAAMRQQRQHSLAELDDRPDEDMAAYPAVQQAQAALDKALLDLSYATVRAPMDGIVSRVTRLQAGDYIKAATPLFALFSTQDVWVEANFKETALTHMRPGLVAEVRIDTWPDYVFHGHIASLAAGTGASFSLLPPENATGNWVKVVQRLPVRIRLDDRPANRVLATGLSAEVTVDIPSQTKAGDAKN